MDSVFSNLFTIQNASLIVGVVVVLIFLKSSVVKQLLDNLKQLGNVQETLLKSKLAEIEELTKTVERLETELKDEKKENKRLRDYNYDDREELARFRREKDK